MAFKATNLLGLRRALKELAKVPSRVSRKMADWINDEWQKNYTNGVDPYDTKHAPLAPATIRRKGHGLTLRHTFAMMGASIARSLRGAGISLSVETPYAHFHLHGTKYHPPRPQLPWRGVPPKWRVQITILMRKACRDTL